ncbi:universal stress protein [Variovorax sp. H27-G14]|uniref:universal stress protein n=1 Tax=Variovorax sp. H27-G14 TaxID=3111914 RepID=UPI0038FC223E
MTYATLMVHLQPGRSNVAVLAWARRLAGSFNAAVVGIAATQPMPMAVGDGLMAADLYELSRDEMTGEVGQAEAEFRSALAPTVTDLSWRSASLMTSLPDYMAREMRSADLLLTGVDASDYFDNMRRVDTTDLIMRAGRPVLLVPALAETPRMDRMMIGWKDTRETRRAVVDALPLLRMAAHVTLAEVRGEATRAEGDSRLADVAVWLARHGVDAECVSSPPGGDDATVLFALGQDRGIDITVAGAYGHSRLREWALGGVTRDLLVSGQRCSLVSH